MKKMAIRETKEQKRRRVEHIAAMTAQERSDVFCAVIEQRIYGGEIHPNIKRDVIAVFAPEYCGIASTGCGPEVWYKYYSIAMDRAGELAKDENVRAKVFEARLFGQRKGAA